MKTFAIILIILALVVGIVPQFTDCQSQGRSLVLENGKTVPMKCHWTAQAEFALSLPLLGVGLLMVFNRRKETVRTLSALGILLGGMVLAVPTFLIGVCGSAMVCHTGTGIPLSLPSLFLMPARRFPAVKFILAHCGGPLLALEAIVAATFQPNIYLELSSIQPHQVATVLAHVEPSRLMIGSDLPENLDAEIGKILALDIPPEAQAAILWDTPQAVFDSPA